MLAGHHSTRDAYKFTDNAVAHAQPLRVSEYYQNNGFIAQPFLDAAEQAGAILLDPSSSMCHDGLCPKLDPNGYSAYMDSDHYRPSFARQYASFLDVAFNVAGLSPTPTEYCLP